MGTWCVYIGVGMSDWASGGDDKGRIGGLVERV